MTRPQDVPAPSPTVSEAMREAVAQWLRTRFFLSEFQALARAEAFCGPAGPIASALAALEREGRPLAAPHSAGKGVLHDEVQALIAVAKQKVAERDARIAALERESATLRATAERMEAALKAAETRFSDIAAGNAFQPRLHAATGATEVRAALTPKETPDA